MPLPALYEVVKFVNEFRPHVVPRELVEVDHWLWAREGVPPAPAITLARTIDTVRRQEAARIIANWIVQVATLPHFRARPEHDLQSLQGFMPDLLKETLTLLALHDPGTDPDAFASAIALAGLHGHNRATHDEPIEVLLMEFYLLQSELWSAVWRLIDQDSSHRNSLRSLQNRLDAVTNRLMTEAVGTWMAERQTQMRTETI